MAAAGLAHVLLCAPGLAAAAGLPLLGDSQHTQVLWQIGQFDASAREFALAPNDANRFAERFGECVTFRISEMAAAGFPFIHPSKADVKWGGREEIPFAITFVAPDAPGNYALVIALVDTHERLSSTMEVALNGRKVWERAMPLGRGRAYYGEVDGRGPVFLAPLGPGLVRQGENDLEITLRGGSWVAYDAIALARVFVPKLPIPAAPSRRQGEVEVRAAEIETGGALLAPLEGGFYVAAASGGWARIASPLPSSGFRAEFDLRVLTGEVTLELELPEGARDSAWAVDFSATQGAMVVRSRETRLSRIIEASGGILRADWAHCVVEDAGSAVSFAATETRTAAASRMSRVPSPGGRLMWRCAGEGAAFAVANLRCQALPAVNRAGELLPRKPEQLEVRYPMPEVKFDDTTGRLTIANAALELVVETRERLNPRSLRSVASGRLFADDDYVYRFGDGRPQLVGKPAISERPDGGKPVRRPREVALISRIGDLEIEQRFTALAAAPAIEEQVTIRNRGSSPLDTSSFACGFAKRLPGSDGGLADPADRCAGRDRCAGCDSRVIAIPYRRDTETGEFCDYRLADLAWQSGWYHTASRQPKVMTPAFGSEGWAFSDATESLLIVKYNPEAMEWSLIEPQFRDDKNLALRFGGAGMWKRGDPEAAARLEPGREFTFGITRYEVCPGGWQAAFQAFRRFMEGNGHRTPAGYDPPVHWNELYDNPLWWGPDTAERRAQLYRREDMEAEARKAAELGCEALYFDPGWDTSFASSIWDAERLGPQTEFARRAREEHGLALAFHTPLAGWSDINAYPLAARRKDADGNRLDSLCSAAPAYIEEKAQRLIKLCDDGAAFLMFDGSAYTGECWDAAHGHSLPLTRQEHCLAYRELTRRVKERHPEVLIELHDPIVAGVNVRYAPTYFLHGGPRDFDELWGYEYMWDPMDDLYSGRALSLYYVNLAYSIPIYLHIDLRKDNANALEFWWYASTCRHLGVGGRHPDATLRSSAASSLRSTSDQVWIAHKQAMQTYRRLKRFYTQGAFYGLDETVHAHTLPDEGRCVLNVFNLADVEVERDIRFKLADIGLKSGRGIAVDGLPACGGRAWNADGDEVRLTLKIPARGHRLVEVGVG